jgi:hypothetical protein
MSWNYVQTRLNCFYCIAGVVQGVERLQVLYAVASDSRAAAPWEEGAILAR